MQNLNQAIKALNKKYNIYITVIFLTFIQNAYCQTQETLPTEFQNLSINAKALEKNLELTVDKDTGQTAQSFVLDKTGVILHLKPTPHIKDNSIKINLISEEGKEVKLFNFIDGTVFALVSPEKTYSIVQEIIPSCDALAKQFNLDKSMIICPDTESFKIYEKIMINTDTSFKISLRTPSEFYSATLVIPENTDEVDSSFKSVKIINPENDTETVTEETSNTSINAASLLTLGELCFSSSVKSSKNNKISECSFKNKNTQSIIAFKKDFKDKIILTPQNTNTTLIFSYLPNLFPRLRHDYLFSFKEDFNTQNPSTEINRKSPKKLFLESFTSKINLNLGQISALKTKIKKNIFSLTSTIELNKTLSLFSFNLPVNNLEPIINPFTDLNIDSVLTNLTINGKQINSTDLFNISIFNNVIVKNLAEPETKESSMTRLQIPIEENIRVSTYLPSNNYDITASSTYTSVEQKIAPSVDEKGNSTEVVNNKSKSELVLSKIFNNINLSDPALPVTLNTEKASKLLGNKLFKNQFSLSGFLIPPDFRPILEDGYRANIDFSMTINIEDENILNLFYTDLKTKEETPLTNFFEFSFLPEGTYAVNLIFNGEREKLFQKAGIMK